MTELISICRQKFPQGLFNFFVDNARIHHANIITDFLNRENINIVFLSPYSYMLNPIEYSFSKIKSVVRRELSNGYNGTFVE